MHRLDWNRESKKGKYNKQKAREEERGKKWPECINFYLHVSIWTWCAFTMWDLFGIENLIWNCIRIFFLLQSIVLTLCCHFFPSTLSTFDTFSSDSQHIFFRLFVTHSYVFFVVNKIWMRLELEFRALFFQIHREIYLQFKYDVFLYCDWISAIFVINYITLKINKIH